MTRPDRKTFIPFGNSADHSIDFLIGTIEDARATTLQRVYDISPEELHWQYAEGWNTIGALLSHIISCGHFFRIDFIEERELSPEEEQLYTPGFEMGSYIPELITGEPISVYLKKMEEAKTLLLEALANVSPEDFFRKRPLYHEETGANLAWIIYHMAEDEVHHRGQISLLRKLYKEERGE